MKYSALLFTLALIACQSSDPSPETLMVDQQNIETTVRNLYVSMKKAYTYGGMNTDSLLDVYYDPSSYYVTPWATTEIIDSTNEGSGDNHRGCGLFNHGRPCDNVSCAELGSIVDRGLFVSPGQIPENGTPALEGPACLPGGTGNLGQL